MTYSIDNYSQYNKTGDKHIFERVLDDLMVEKYGHDKEITLYINSLPKEDKRLAILSLLDGNNNMWKKVKALIKGSRVDKVDHLKDIISLFREYIKIADVERKTHGEIMTPFKELALPMVELIDKYDPNFWKNPNHKVLDSSAGIGTFLVICAAKFMNGLKNIKGYEDPEFRFKWIVENCLYYGELQSRNCFLWLCAIDPYNEYNTNTYWGSFLSRKNGSYTTDLSGDFDKHMKEVWRVENFDLIIQNSPYQELKEGFTKSQPIWQLFVQKSLKILKYNAYMVMVHPSGWRNVDGVFKQTQNLLKEKQILELHIHNESDGMKMFGADTRYDYYILINKQCESETNIRCQDGSFDKANLAKMEFIPNGMFKLFTSLLSDGNSVSVIGDSSYHTQRNFLSKERSDIFKFPCIYTIKSGDVLTLWWSNKDTNGHFRIPKMVWSNFRISSAGSFVDVNGDYGLTQFSYAIVDSVENLNQIKKAFDTKRFRNLMEVCSVGDMSINRKVIATFKKDFWKEFI